MAFLCDVFFLRASLIIGNILVMASGLMVMGVSAIVNRHLYRSSISTFAPGIRHSVNVFIITGMVTCLVGGVGCISACFKAIWVTITYMAAMLLVISLEVTVGVTGFSLEETTCSNIQLDYLIILTKSAVYGLLASAVLELILYVAAIAFYVTLTRRTGGDVSKSDVEMERIISETSITPSTELLSPFSTTISSSTYRGQLFKSLSSTPSCRSVSSAPSLPTIPEDDVLPCSPVTPILGANARLIKTGKMYSRLRKSAPPRIRLNLGLSPPSDSPAVHQSISLSP